MKRRDHLMAAAIISLILIFGSQSLRAAWGDYDTSFGFLGAAIDQVTGHYPIAVALQADGKILVTGHRMVNGYRRFFLRRYLTNGSLDTSFGNSGTAVPGGAILTTADYGGTGIAVQANGRIAVVGYGNGKRTVWRFYSNGSPDTSIGFGGMKTLSYAANSNPPYDAIEAQGDNLIVSFTGSSGSLMSMVRILSSGVIDTNFGGSGVVATSFFYQTYRVTTDEANGKIIVAGTYNGGGSFGLTRWFEDGTIDNSFQPDPQSSQIFNDGEHVPLQNGKYLMRDLAPGYLFQLPNSGSTLKLFGPNGQFEQSIAIESFSGQPTSTCPQVFAQQSDGQVVAKGVDKIYRVNANLNTSSLQSINCGAYASVSGRTEAVLQADDKMVAAGRYNGYIILVRTLP